MKVFFVLIHFKDKELIFDGFPCTVYKATVIMNKVVCAQAATMNIRD